MEVVTKKLEDIASIQYGFPFNSKLFGETGPIRVLRIRDIKGTADPTYYTGDYEPDYEVGKGDMLVGMDGEFNCTIWNAGRALLNQRMARIIPKSSVDKTYLYYFLKTKLKLLEEQTVGSTVKHLLDPQLRRIEISLPPFETQRRIGSTLERSDKLRWKREHANELTSKVIQSVFLKMFGDPERNEMGWPVRRLGDLIQVSRKTVVPDQRHTNMLHVGGENIERGTGRLINVRTIGEDGIKSINFIFDPTHILYCKIRPNLRKVASPNFAGLCSADIYPLSPKPGVTREFLCQLLRSNAFTKYATSVSMSRANIPKINREELQSYIAISPPSSLQESFAKLVVRVREMTYRQEASSTEINELFNSLMNKAFRGQLGGVESAV